MPKVNDQYFRDNFNTPLSAQEQAAYRAWTQGEMNRTGRDFSQDTADYDMQGWFKHSRGQRGNDARGHFPDTFKKPNHPTFSDQSQYHNAPAPWGDKFQGGTWAPDGSAYTPSKAMLQNTHPEEWLRGYMQEREPKVKLVLPE